MIKKTLAIFAAVVVIALFAVAGTAQAWTAEECPTPETHEDCLQYFPSPTVEPSAEPTPEPTVEPTPEPTAEPTAEPTPEPTDTPTATPSPDDKDDSVTGDGPTGPTLETPASLPAAGAALPLGATAGLYAAYLIHRRFM